MNIDIIHHYPPEILNLLVDTIPLLCRSKNDVLVFFKGAGVPGAVTAALDRFQRGWATVKVDWALRAPIPWRDPQVGAAGTVHLADSIDERAVTAAEISGYALPNSAAEDSYCLTPIFFGKADQPVRPYTLHQTWGPYYAIRMGSWKYLDHAGSGGNDYQKKPGLAEYYWPDLAGKTSAQLYDLAADPGEKRNLILEQPQRAERMKALLHQSIQIGRSAPVR